MTVKFDDESMALPLELCPAVTWTFENITPLPEFTDRPAHGGYPGKVVVSLRRLRDVEMDLELMVGSDVFYGQPQFHGGPC